MTAQHHMCINGSGLLMHAPPCLQYPAVNVSVAGAYILLLGDISAVVPVSPELFTVQSRSLPISLRILSNLSSSLVSILKVYSCCSVLPIAFYSDDTIKAIAFHAVFSWPSHRLFDHVLSLFLVLVLKNAAMCSYILTQSGDSNSVRQRLRFRVVAKE